MKLAYLIMAHTDPKHLRRLVDALNVKGKTDFYVHVDSKVDIDPFKAELNAVTGQYFSVKLSANDAAKGKRFRVHLYVNGASVHSNLVKISDTGDASTEFEVEDGQMSVIVQDADSGMQLDSAIVSKSLSRDIDDLI